jgi:hypothetical protein
MLYVGSLLHVNVKTVAYLYDWLVFLTKFCTFTGNIYDLQCLLNFLSTGIQKLQKIEFKTTMNIIVNQALATMAKYVRTKFLSF